MIVVPYPALRGALLVSRPAGRTLGGTSRAPPVILTGTSGAKIHSDGMVTCGSPAGTRAQKDSMLPGCGRASQGWAGTAGGGRRDG
jgi:hypothetical protein